MILQTVGFFHSAHFLSNYKGKCKNIHGHTYAYFVKIFASDKSKEAIMFDFSTIKKMFDHKLLFNKREHPHYEEIGGITLLGREGIEEKFDVLGVNGNPTAENITKLIVKTIKDEVKNCEVIVRVWENIEDLINIQKLKNADGEYIEIKQ